ncbi:MAG: hypothetical protein V2B14_04370 [bacterium]
MKDRPDKKLKSSINQLSYKINQIKSSLDTCEESNRIYNRLLIERACIRKKLKEFQSKSIISFLCKKLTIFKRNKQKLICDYFNSK